MLGGLYERIRREEYETEWEKIGLRKVRGVAWEENTLEADAEQRVEDEALASMKYMFGIERRKEKIE